MSSGEVDWERVRRGAWVRDLLSSRTDEEVAREPKRAHLGGKNISGMKK
jgi:hypothetical protein